MKNLSVENIRKIADKAVKMIEKDLGTEDGRARDLVVREINQINVQKSLIDQFESNPENMMYN